MHPHHVLTCAQMDTKTAFNSTPHLQPHRTGALPSLGVSNSPTPLPPLLHSYFRTPPPLGLLQFVRETPRHLPIKNFRKHALTHLTHPRVTPPTPTHTHCPIHPPTNAPPHPPAYEYMTLILVKSTYDDINPSLTPKFYDIYHIVIHNTARVNGSSKL